jgi:hypothetical protein
MDNIPENIHEINSRYGSFLVRTYHALMNSDDLDESQEELLSLVRDLTYSDELLTFQMNLIDSELPILE